MNQIIIKYANNTYNDDINYQKNKENVVARLINYIWNEEKISSRKHKGYKNLLCRNLNNNIKNVINSMENQYYTTQILCGQTEGEKLVHLIIIYHIENFSASEAFLCSDYIAEEIGKEYQVVYSIHKREKNSIYKDEKENIHAHFIINTISYNNGTWYDKTDKQRISACKGILKESINCEFRVYLENI